MAEGSVYYHVVLTVAHSRPMFLVDEIDAAFKDLVYESAKRGEWRVIELETMPNHVHVLLEKAPWQDLMTIVKALKAFTARKLFARFDWLRDELDSAHLWVRGHHYVRHDEASLPTVRAYIRDQRRAGGISD